MGKWVVRAKSLGRKIWKVVYGGYYLGTFVPAVLGLFSFFEKLSVIRALGNFLAKVKIWVADILKVLNQRLPELFLDLVNAIGGTLGYVVDLYRKFVFDRLYALLPVDIPEFAADILFVTFFSMAFALRAALKIPLVIKEKRIEREQRTGQRKRSWWDRFWNGGPEYEDYTYEVPVERDVSISNLSSFIIVGLRRFAIIAVAMGIILAIDAGYETLIAGA